MMGDHADRLRTISTILAEMDTSDKGEVQNVVTRLLCELTDLTVEMDAADAERLVVEKIDTPTPTEPTLDAPRVRTAVERAALTTPNGLPWTKRAMPPEHVERLRNGHLCHGYDCVTCVWVATLDALLAEKDRRIGELEAAFRDDERATSRSPPLTGSKAEPLAGQSTP